MLLIAPRKPDEGNNDVVDGIFDPPPPFDDVDGLQGNGMVLSEGDVNKLTFCCCECCHGHPCCGVSNFCCNIFPQHITANQFFTLECLRLTTERATEHAWRLNRTIL